MAIPPQSRFLADESMDANITSEAIDLTRAGACSIELHSDSATHAGAITIEVSNSGDNWNAMGWTNPATGAWVTSDTVAAGSAYNFFIDLSNIGARYIRVIYTRSSGTGALDGYAFGKNWSHP